MISVPPELKKLNDFKHVEIPSPERFFARSGYMAVASTQFTGDEVARVSQNKVDELAAFADLNDQYLHAESVKVEENEHEHE